MSRIRADKLANKAGTGAPQLQYGAEIPIGYGITGAGGVNITGVITAGSFSGDGSGLIGVASTDYIVTGTAATFNNQVNVGGVIKLGPAGVVTATTFDGNATGLSGTPTITVGNITAVDGTFSGNVSIAKTLTYEDVTNIDSVGLITARKGIVSSGVVTATSFDGEFKVVDESIDTLCFPLFSPNISVSGGKASGIGSICAGSNLYFNSATGELSATSYAGDGSNLTGVVSGIEVEDSGSSVGTSLTAINFVGATVTGDSTAGISTVTIGSSGISTAVFTPTNGQTVTLNLNTAQDHKINASGTVHITTINGTEGESHTVRITNDITTNIGFSTNFLWASGSPPAMPTTAGEISLISFTVHKVGVGTQLLSGASVSYT
jgi:hypothetical protein